MAFRVMLAEVTIASVFQTNRPLHEVEADLTNIELQLKRESMRECTRYWSPRGDVDRNKRRK